MQGAKPSHGYLRTWKNFLFTLPKKVTGAVPIQILKTRGDAVDIKLTGI